jgi:hypothetical protein
MTRHVCPRGIPRLNVLRGRGICRFPGRRTLRTTSSFLLEGAEWTHICILKGLTPVRERNWGRGRCRKAVLPWLHSDGKRILSTPSEAYYLVRNRKYAVRYAHYGTVPFVRSTASHNPAGPANLREAL